jgi:heat shock protein HtpX
VSIVLVGLFYLFAQIYDPSLVFLFLIIAVILSTLGTIASYWYSDKIVLSVTKTREPSPLEQEHLSNVVEGLAIAAGIPTPRFIIAQDDNLNAFATGRDPEHAVLAVTSGLLNTMNREELEGVVAHEMSHINNYDIRFASMVAVLVGIVVIAAQIFLRGMMFSGGGGGGRRNGGGNVIFLVIGIILAILAPIFTQLVQLAVSRQREYLADSSGAYLTRNPEGLASALEKIKNFNINEKVNGAVSHLYFVNPLLPKNAESLFATHPPIEERIRRLREM